MSQEIMRKAHQEVFAITKKTLADLASTSLEDQTVSVFIRRIAGLTEVEKKQFVTAFDSPGRPILIQTAFELPAPQRSEIESAVRKLIEPKAGFEYGTESGLISGIEMNANGYKLAWSVSDYLSSMKNIFIENPGLEKGEKENVAG
jgi:F-type H+-transporting ATPase subunit b